MKLRSVVLSILMLVSFTCQAKEPLSDVQQLGKLLFQDKNLSLNRNQSCASCHSLQPAGVMTWLVKWSRGLLTRITSKMALPFRKARLLVSQVR